MADPADSSPAPPSSTIGSKDSAHRLVPGVATAAAALVYTFLALRRVSELRANAFDAGFIDNVLYKVSSGLGDVSGLTGVPHFIDHASALLLLAIPVYWLNADIAYRVLLILQAISVAMVGLAAWLIADSIGLSRGHRGAVLLYVLASPAAYWAIITELHLTGLSMGLVAMMIAGAFRRWRLSVYWILPVLASLARVEIALTVVVAGLLLLGVSRAHARVAIISGVSIGGLLAMFMILAPDQGSSVGAHFDYLGIDSFSEIPAAMVQQPGEVLRQLLNPIFVASVVMWLITIGLALPLRAPRWFLIGVPMLVVAAIGSPAYADLWFQHYWNFLLVGAAVAFALSLKMWSWSNGIVNTLVVVTLVVAWIIPGSLILRPQLIDPFYPPASASDQEAAARSSSAVGAVSTLSKLVPPGAHREWIYNFPNPFVCHADQYAYFKLSGPAPDVVITKLGWGEMVDPSDIAGLRDTLATDYQITDRFGTYTVRERIPGASPRLVAECRIVEAGE